MQAPCLTLQKISPKKPKSEQIAEVLPVRALILILISCVLQNERRNMFLSSLSLSLFLWRNDHRRRD